MSSKKNDDELAYGDYNKDEGKSSSGKSFMGSFYRKFTGKEENEKPEDQQASQSPTAQIQGLATSLLGKVHTSVHQLGSDISAKLSSFEEIHTHTHASGECSDGSHSHSAHRYRSYAPQRVGNEIKWYVDGCSYMWAVSKALESAKESIWILDWWLSPELYLRRPPSQFEQYRLDRMLEAAASRGVKVKVIIYKEVTQALTRKLLNPVLPNVIHSLLPESTDAVTRLATRLGLDVIFRSLEEVEAENPLIGPPVTVSSAHTKHHLERLHPNISVFRHPDHLPDRKVLQSDILSSFQNMSLTAANLSKLPGDAVQGIYGVSEGAILYWAHHEKLCLIDGRTAFMGGLDLCYGRWDTYQHSIADAHPGDLSKTIFPGQDFNNARIMDFHDVRNWENNKLDRTKSSRMGWSDVALCLAGPTVEDLKAHFSERWNVIYDEKYRTRTDERYHRLDYMPTSLGVVGEYSQPVHHRHGPDFIGHKREGQEKGVDIYGKENKSSRRSSSSSEEGGKFRDQVKHMLHEGKEILEEASAEYHRKMAQSAAHIGPESGTVCQLTRSCSKWSHGTKIEHSIANAYIDIIANSQHFIYIENQFFITATSDQQKPVRNKIGKAIVDRIVRAARAGEKYKVFVVIPAVPGFAGDLKADDALGTRAIMEFQYFSINRGGYSIMESIAKEGIDPMQYIRFYNLRNYDRINSSGKAEAESQSGVSYEKAREQYDAKYDASDPSGLPASLSVNRPHGAATTGTGDAYQDYQEGARRTDDGTNLKKGRWDSVAECYMLGGEDIRNVPWASSTENEIDAFVSEELYIHSKVLIADDRIVVCGSANLNDRSQLGNHDSEIAILIEDPILIDSHMNGQPWKASKFAASLRRYLFRKHLGLVRPQDPAIPDANYEPIGTPNEYDWGSEQDKIVTDPLSDGFLSLWYNQARTNTDAFHKVFRPVPTDHVRNWRQYDDYYTRYFGIHDGSGTSDNNSSINNPLANTTNSANPGTAASTAATSTTNSDKNNDQSKDAQKPKYEWGHVVAEQFSPGAKGAAEVKEILSRVRGSLVEMPLLFLKDEDIAKEGLGLNAFTEDVYT